MLHARHGGINPILICSSKGDHKCLKNKEGLRRDYKCFRHNHDGAPRRDDDVSVKGLNLSPQSVPDCDTGLTANPKENGFDICDFLLESFQYIVSRVGKVHSDEEKRTETSPQEGSKVFCTDTSSGVSVPFIAEPAVRSSSVLQSCTVAYFVPRINSR